MAEGYTIKHIDEFEEMEGSGGATWRLARKTLGAEAFGFNVVDIEPGGQIPAHDQTGDDQEEVFIILEGEGTIVADDEEHAAPAGHLLPLRPRGQPHDPEQLRRDRPSAADRRPGRQRLQADALGLAGEPASARGYTRSPLSQVADLLFVQLGRRSPPRAHPSAWRAHATRVRPARPSARVRHRIGQLNLSASRRASSEVSSPNGR